jgi:glycosyltransferase involved in cell wall biosynthesis
MKIGILGSRGIPNAYGGFEQFAQYLAEGLLYKGHEVYVYNSSLHPYKKNSWNGIGIIHCKDRENKFGTAGQFLYDLNCIRDSRKRNFDILLHLGYTSDSVWWRQWPKNTVNIMNMDGLEWKRSKYSRFTKMFLRKAESWAANHANKLVADSEAIQQYLGIAYKKKAAYIPYGATVFGDPDKKIVESLALSPLGYWLVVARIEPENNIEMVIRGWLNSTRKFQLVIVGNSNNDYGKQLRKKYGIDGIKFAGPIYDQLQLNNLRHYCKIYFHGHSVGGTNPSLLEAMACNAPIAAHENVFNKAVLSDDAFYFFSAGDVTNIMNGNHNPELIKKWQAANLTRIVTVYNWKKIIDEYEKVMMGCLADHQS